MLRTFNNYTIGPNRCQVILNIKFTYLNKFAFN